MTREQVDLEIEGMFGLVPPGFLDEGPIPDKYRGEVLHASEHVRTQTQAA